MNGTSGLRVYDTYDTPMPSRLKRYQTEGHYRVVMKVLFVTAVLAVGLLLGELPCIANKAPKATEKRSFLEERGSPFKAVQQNGSVLFSGMLGGWPRSQGS